jgi:sugar/nucleoside kinase (ribokinase family)
VGDDALGRKVVDELAAAGVTLAVSTDAKLATGICIVLVDPDGERTMVPCAGANAVGGSMPPLDPGSHVHLSGYALFYGSFGVAEIICDARARQCTLSVDAASAAPLRAFGPDAFLDVISPALLLANEDEAAALTGMTDPEPAARALGHRSGEVIVKCGSRGGIWSDGTQVVRAATAPVVPVDSTGAGDAFAAGVLAARLSGASVADTLAAGNQLASRVISRRGGRP